MFLVLYMLTLIIAILGSIGFTILYFRLERRAEQEGKANATKSIDPLPPQMPDSWIAPADKTIMLRPSSIPPPNFVLPSILDEEEDHDQNKILTNRYGSCPK